MVWYLYLSESPLSHLDTLWRLTPSWLASSSWDQPFFFRKSIILSARIMRIAPFVFFAEASCLCTFILTKGWVAHHQAALEICQLAVASAWLSEKCMVCFRLLHYAGKAAFLQEQNHEGRKFFLRALKAAKRFSFSHNPAQQKTRASNLEARAYDDRVHSPSSMRRISAPRLSNLPMRSS